MFIYCICLLKRSIKQAKGFECNIASNGLTLDSLGSTLIIIDTNIHTELIIFLQLLTIDKKHNFCNNFFYKQCLACDEKKGERFQLSKVEKKKFPTSDTIFLTSDKC